MELKKFEARNAPLLRPWIADFFGYHAELVGATPSATDESVQLTLAAWTTAPSELYLIKYEDVPVGFLRLNFKGDIAAWLEDLYIVDDMRGQGLATRAIGMAEHLVRQREGLQAMCLEVAPRNEAALRLYRKLGFTDLSLMTLRKEFGESRRDRPLSVLGQEFFY